MHSRTDIEMDAQFIRKSSRKSKLHPKVKKHIDKLKGPSESVEFMEHMLE
jgi:hypothetical protein